MSDPSTGRYLSIYTYFRSRRDGKRHTESSDQLEAGTQVEEWPRIDNAKSAKPGLEINFSDIALPI